MEPSWPPFGTGAYPQLVRKFYTTDDGLADASIQAVTATRNGGVWVACKNGLSRLDGERWVNESIASPVRALFAPAKGPEALAGAADGVWALADGKWQREADSPAGVIALAAEPDGTPWALAPSGVWRRGEQWQRVHAIHDDLMFGVRGLLPSGPEDVLMVSQTGLFQLRGKRKYWLPLEVRPDAMPSADTRAIDRLDANHFLVVSDKGLTLSNGSRGWCTFTGAEGLPITDLSNVAVGADGSVWLGSKEGLIRWSGGQWLYLAGKRWLPNDRVTALAPASEGSIWVGTDEGLARIYHRTMTLEKKAAHFQEIAESRNRRHGYMGELQLASPGVVEGALQEVSDNDGLRAGLYAAAESFRFAVTKDPSAKAQAWRAMEAMLRLETMTGIPGFPARAICHVDEPQFAQRSLRSDPEWHESPVETGWYWKGETSSDELDGHYFGWYVFHELAANHDEKQAVRAVVKRVTDHLLDHGYRLVDIDGKPTTWGSWAPEQLNDDPVYWPERGLNSLEILSHLRVAHRIVGEERYQQAYNELIKKHHYAMNTLRAKVPGGVSHDDQLMFLAYYPLLQIEQGAGLRALYTASLNSTWQLERSEANPLWNFIYGASTGGACDVENAVASLREIPLDFIQWRMHNSRRADLKYEPALDEYGGKKLVRPLQWAERFIQNWDHNPYQADGGSDMGEADPTVWLLPYWMGRHHRIFE